MHIVANIEGNKRINHEMSTLPASDTRRIHRPSPGIQRRQEVKAHPVHGSGERDGGSAEEEEGGATMKIHIHQFRGEIIATMHQPCALFYGREYVRDTLIEAFGDICQESITVTFNDEKVGGFEELHA
jgi:hypothetical protein